ncbi:Isy1-domain-containing protein [Athelia psychrophila]|uniref:Isy1-domain-containing protein n=1 Tax=Athelia psychrophila TaxID=1759441 RepID=A0A165ZIG2_9AGAM|nr:Isy1-domain-containing protein [Fibularhizoctonia sp. CBS 109695]
MARNEEKAQSMLYRFREAQAGELGLGTRSDRRPRMASACKSLRDCERWRGEILREISRKVSKIQDAGLTDYECRDLNDEINKLMREKRHWENQIIALGGANYRRNVAMLDDDGKEVPGTKGYKYFGRAKDLPGVRELFEGRKKEEEEENQALAYYKKFMNQGPSYFGDLDEADGRVLEFERQAEDEDWEEAYSNLKAAIGLPTSHPTPPIPRPSQAITASMDSMTINAPNQAKRKIADEDEEMPLAPEAEAAAPSKSKGKAKAKPKSKSKKSKTEAPAEEAPAAAAPVTSDTDAKEDADPQVIHARAAAAYIPFLTPADLLPPVLPTREEMEGVLLGLRKRALVEEYFGEGEETAL